MSKILLYTDNHFSETSSVIRSRGQKFSTRIENQIKMLNWINELAKKEKCERIFCLGDFFDKPDLTAEEITAISTVDLSKHEIVVGNHEAISNNLVFTSVNTISNCKIYSKPEIIEINGKKIGILPYSTEQCRQPLKDIFGEIKDEFFMILSHNDIFGIQYGAIESRQGYKIDEILENCDLFINGHIHNGNWIREGRILNLGSVTGINFSNDASIWKPVVSIFDTETLTVDLIENPYAFMFYKKDFSKLNSLEITLNTIKKFIESLNQTQQNILSIKISNLFVSEVQKLLENYDWIYYKRILLDYSTDNKSVETEHNSNFNFDIDYFSKFKDFILKVYDSSSLNQKLMLEEISLLTNL